ncbi:Polyadenylate-binding protein 2 [Orchesella cincta]|uniref:Polyadenylate-binding protein 2 n=1 Tax=Orchesella cincta TaxID=48709 RepID=A0A1D2MIZ0_ORCCI|nr:Polyadenylate-binding protein 2 [Orchesella cincta]
MVLRIEQSAMMDDSVEEHDEHEEEEDEDLQNAYTSEQEGGTQDSNENVTMMDDSELEAIKARVREMEEEAEKLKQLQSEVDRQMNIGTSTSNTGSSLLVSSSSPSNSANSSLANSGLFPSTLSIEEKMEVDGRSIYVGNVDYGATAEELEQHFHGCGSINRVTILCNKYDGHPKGFAYIEFADKESVNTAMALDESLFRGRQIKVSTYFY